MINHIYQLVSPGLFAIKYSEEDIVDKVIIKPSHMAICHADQRYYLGLRSRKILEKKLPMALIHEFCGHVVCDPTGNFSVGELVTVIPNTPRNNDDNIYENYRKNSIFLSSGYDGFMREYVVTDAERVVSVDGVPEDVAAITEFVSVATHAVLRYDSIAHSKRKRIGIWGDGSLAYVMSNVIKFTNPDVHVTVIGKSRDKLSYFSFVNDVFLASDLSEDFTVDHAFECCGGEGSFYAIEDIIKYIEPQGSIMLMGVSESNVAINTRMVLEKGLTLVGCSRSGKQDFLVASNYLANKKFQSRLKKIIYEANSVSSIEDIHRVFERDGNTSFKTVFKWCL
ncbi:MAG: alcohol dehydrogenase catalytic domain-containing protein [Agathobacter sp.]|nr:alcohol dehydrogenase catalytic domain-containing protein [Lachnospiraceae bacterium]MBR3811063.1 alcohol dehydrogenase catalytic domain-containing protein [Agathobacter sp.]MBR4059091.1 alcohol dehydrogenase catalytic domain-containing protein [Lachnospiraceae bacterium]